MATNQINIPEGFEIEYNPNEIPEGFEIENQNSYALNNSVNEVSSSNNAIKTSDFEVEQLANVLFTEEEIKAIKSKGQIGWCEYAKNFADYTEAVPFYGMGKDIQESGKVFSIAKKMENGEEVSDADKSFMNKYLREYAEIQMRGMSWGSKGVNVLVNAPAFIGEMFLTGLGGTAAKGVTAAAIKGAGAAATKAAVKAGSKIATSKVASEILGVKATEKIGTKAALEVSAKIVSEAAARQAVLVPLMTVEHFNEKKIADGLNITEKGNNLVFDTQKAESNQNALKSLTNAEIEILSEMSGGLIGHIAGTAKNAITKAIGEVATTNIARGVSAVSAKIYNSLPKATRVKLEATAKVVDDFSTKAFDLGGKIKNTDIAFHGVLEEMGEERLADVMRYAFDLDEQEGYSLDQLGSAIFPEWQQLLLEAGVFSIVGSMSLATRTVYNNLLDKGYSKEEAQTVVENLSELEKENMANDIIGEVAINKDITEEEVAQEQEAIQLKLFGGVEEIVQTEEIMFDMANTAGADSAEFSDAQKEWEEKGTDSKYFKKWFGDSKVVDENGKPLIVYHGTQAEPFSVFGENQKGWRTKKKRTFYFSTSKDYSKTFAGINSKGEKTSEHSQIMEVYLSLKNPLVVSNEEIEDVGYWLSDEELDNLEKQGYDGFITEDMGQIVVLHPEQIKSVDNKGTFDSENDNIYYDVENKTSKSEVIPIVIEEGSVPKFETINELKTWIKENLNLIGDITIKSNGRVVQFSNTAIARSMKGINRSDAKRDSFSKLKEIVEGAVPKKQKPSDERHQGVEGQEIYYNEFIYKGKTLGIEIAVDIPKSKNAPYVFAGHKIKKASAATRDGSKELSSNRPDATNSITDIEQNINPVETVVDKIIKGESKWGQFYTDWVDRLTPIENLAKKAQERAEISFSDNPYYQARMYAGLTESIKQQIEKETFIKTPDGKIKVTGEGFMPIIKDFTEEVRSIEPSFDVAINDLSDFLIANRYLLDLKDREGYEATEEQKLKAIKDMANLNLKYDDKIEDFNKIANRIYEYNRRILHNLVDSGNMSQETYDKIIADNPHHISYKRVMDDEYGTSVSINNKFTDAKSPIKKIRGSERDIKNVFVSTLEDVARILDIAERNKVAKSIANLKNVVPEYIEKVNPLKEKRTALVKVTYDAKMRRQLEEVIKFFGRTFENVKSIKTPTGYALGSYSEAEKLVRKKLGSQDRTLAHEVGHMLDYALGIEKQIKNNSEIMKEVSKLAEDRFASVVKLQDGEFVTEEGLNTEQYKSYVKTNKEMIANMLDLYFTSRDYMREVAPNSYNFIDNLFKDKYKFLKDIRPSSETAVEEIEQDVWTVSRQKPYGNVIEYYENGKRKFVEVTKPVMEAVEGLSSQEIDFINRFLVGSASVLRKGATITPEFALRNFIRDQQSATIYIKNYNPFVDMTKGLMNVLDKKITGSNKTYDEWLKAGGAFSSYMELNEKSVDKALKEFVGEKSGLNKMFNPLKPFEEFSSMFEQATRLAMYTRAQLNGANALEAAFESREGTLDFGRSGKFGRLWNKVIPFFNASIQGTDKLIRVFKENPKVVSIKAIGWITIPQIALTGYYLYFAPDDDREEYLNIPQWQKDFFYCFKIGKHWIRIPKNFTLGYVFGSAPERFMTWAYQNKKPEGKELAEMGITLIGSASPINTPVDILPPLIRTMLENVANYDFFRGKHIYPEYLNDVEPSQRYNKYTSESAKILGEALNISPAKIDHTINSLLGSSGRYLTDAGDLILNSVREFNGEEINEQAKELADAPILRGFILRDPIGYQAVSTNEFFENYKEVSTIDKTYKKFKANGENERAIEYRKKHLKELNAYKRMNNINKQIKKISKQMDAINSNSSLKGKEKQELLQPLAKRIADIAFNANVWYGEFIKE